MAEAERAAVEGGPGVGVLGWLAFTISHVAAWCVILISANLARDLGYCLCAAYTGVLVLSALLFERRGGKYAGFVNVLWVLGCIFLFVSGAYLATTAFGHRRRVPDELEAPRPEAVVATHAEQLPLILAPAAVTEQPSMSRQEGLPGPSERGEVSMFGSPDVANASISTSTPTAALPVQMPGAGDEHHEWSADALIWSGDADVDHAVEGTSHRKRPIGEPHTSRGSSPVEVWGDNVLARIQPDFATFRGALFFAALSRRADIAAREDLKEVSVLWYFDGERTVEVLPALLRPRNLLVFKDKLFFSAEGLLMDRQLYCIDSIRGSADLITPLIGKAGGRVHSLRVAPTGPLLFQASFPCPSGTRKESFFLSDGTAHGTTELSTEGCAQVENQERAMPTAEMWAVLFLGDLPTLGVAAWVLATKRMPGVSVNIFAGVWIAVTLLHGITAYEPDLLAFNKWFAVVYSTLCYVGIICVHVIAKENNAWLEGLKAWLQPVVGISYFFAIHAILEIPFTARFWRWLVYLVLNIFQVAASLLLHRMLPIVLALAGQFEVAWKLSREAVRLLFGDTSGELAVLTTLALLALQAIGLVTAAVFYMGRREWIDGRMRELIRGKRGNKLLGESECDESL